jgi:Raf kinase inhibitor-like YbhB/YbcL family protein
VFAAGFKLTSSDVRQGKQLNLEQVYNGFGCTGRNISPELKWTGAPKGTKSFAVTVFDPNAPTGSGWWNWVIFNIPANVTELPKGAGNPTGKVPEGSIQSRTDFGSTGYGGACPPKANGPHHYIFTVYALNVAKLPLDASASGAMVGFFLSQHTLAKANIVAKYRR